MFSFTTTPYDTICLIVHSFNDNDKEAYTTQPPKTKQWTKIDPR